MPLQSSPGQGRGTYVLSFAAFKLSRNCMPLAVVVSTVSVLAFDSACARGFHCQQACPSHLHMWWSLHRLASSAAGVVLRQHGGADGGVRVGLLVEPSRRAPSRSHPASRPTPLARLQTTTDDAISTFGGCTYRHFLALRRATVAIGHSSAGGFALARALHSGGYRGRVVYPSRCKSRATQVSGVVRVQWDAVITVHPKARSVPSPNHRWPVHARTR
jgi:hypothetical protein